MQLRAVHPCQLLLLERRLDTQAVAELEAAQLEESHQLVPVHRCEARQVLALLGQRGKEDIAHPHTARVDPEAGGVQLFEYRYSRIGPIVFDFSRLH